MFKDLPQDLQTQVLNYLQANDFIKAKAVVDEYHAAHPVIDVTMTISHSH